MTLTSPLLRPVFASRHTCPANTPAAQRPWRRELPRLSTPAWRQWGAARPNLLPGRQHSNHKNCIQEPIDTSHGIQLTNRARRSNCGKFKNDGKVCAQFHKVTVARAVLSVKWQNSIDQSGRNSGSFAIDAQARRGKFLAQSTSGMRAAMLWQARRGLALDAPEHLLSRLRPGQAPCRRGCREPQAIPLP